MGKQDFNELSLCDGIHWAKHVKPEFKHIEKNLQEQ